MAFGNKSTIDNSEQEKLKKKRAEALFSSTGMEGKIKYPKNQLVHVRMDLIDQNPDNDSIFNMDGIEVLAERIKTNGYDISQPVGLFEKPDGRYELNSGHRRYMACKKNDMKEIPAVIKEDVDTVRKAENLLESNLLNRELKYYDYARSVMYYRDNVLIPSGKSKNIRKAICEYFHFTDTTLQRYMDFLKLVPELQEYGKRKDFPASVLSKAKDLSEELQSELANNIEQSMDGEGENTITARQLSEMIEIIKKREKHKQEIEKNKEIFESVNSGAYASPYEQQTTLKTNPHVSGGQTAAKENDRQEKEIKVEIVHEVGSMEGAFDDAFEGLESSFVVGNVINQMDAVQQKEISVGYMGEDITNKKPVVAVPYTPKKPDIGVALRMINNQIASITLEDYSIKNKAEATDELAKAVERLTEIMMKIKEDE